MNIAKGLRQSIDDAAFSVAQRNNLSAGHGTNSFKRMAVEVVERIQPDVDAAIEQRVSERLDAERSRITEILDSDAARGREDFARRLALSTDVPPDKARELLAASPKAQRQGRTPLDIAMEGQEHSVGADDGADGLGGSDEVDQLANRILSAE